MQKLISVVDVGFRCTNSSWKAWNFTAKPHWSKGYFQEFSLAVTQGTGMSCGTCFCLWLGYNGCGQGERTEMFANDDFLHISQQALRKGWKESLSRCCYLHSITLLSGDKEIITFKVLGSFSMDWKGGRVSLCLQPRTNDCPLRYGLIFHLATCLNHSDIMDTWKYCRGIRA